MIREDQGTVRVNETVEVNIEFIPTEKIDLKFPLKV